MNQFGPEGMVKRVLNLRMRDGGGWRGLSEVSIRSSSSFAAKLAIGIAQVPLPDPDRIRGDLDQLI